MSLTVPIATAATTATVSAPAAARASRRGGVRPSQPRRRVVASTACHDSSGTSGKSLGGPAVETGRELGRGKLTLVVEVARERGQVVVVGVDREPARPRRSTARDRARPGGRAASRRAPGTPHAASSQALLSFSITRCRRVPAFDSRDRRARGDLRVAEAGEELERDQLALAARLRAPIAVRSAARRSATSRCVLGGRRGSRRPARRPARLAPAPPQLVEGGVARDPEQPGAAAAAARVEAARACGRRARRRARSRPRRRSGREAAPRRRRRRRRGSR